ncbi:MAG: cellulase family glycosylhydrolase [Thermotogota bacterium]|nr:cellulase family glycosylhydrolase [Thermotogota bacterium]
MKNNFEDFLLGINYWSRSGALFMWEDEFWNPTIIEEEIITMKSLRMNICRSFIFSNSFMREPEKVDKERIKRFKKFIALCEKHNLKTIPTFLVGHMSGENWDFEFRNNRDLYSDPFMLKQQEFLIRSIVEEIKNSRAIWGYLLSNEMPLYGGKSSPEKIYNWASSLIQIIRKLDPDRPVGIGDGCWNALGGQNGFDLGRLSKIVDFFGPHMYVSEPDTYRHSLLAEFLIGFCKRYKLPVIMEEFGASSSHSSDENISRYYREVLFNTYFSGGKGALGWCLSDFDYPDMKPYVHHPFELNFGILDKEGNQKKVAEELTSFGNFVDSINSFKRPEKEAAIVISRFYNEDFPFSEDDRIKMALNYIQSYTLAVKAGMEVDIVGEKPDDWKEYKLLIFPCAKKYSATTWENVIGYVKKGSNVYFSYFEGSTANQQGLWMHNFNEVTNCFHSRRYGLPNILPETLEISFHNIKWDISTAYCESVWEKSFLPIHCSDNNEVIDLNKSGLKLVINKMENGKIFFLNFPIEYILGATPKVNDSDVSYSIYRFMANDLNLKLYRTDNAMVRLRKFFDGSKQIMAMQNVSWQKQKIRRIYTPEPVDVDEQLESKQIKLI